MLRERMTGRPLPAEAEAVVAPWRDWVLDLAEGDLEALVASAMTRRASPIWPGTSLPILAWLGAGSAADSADQDGESDAMDEQSEGSAELEPQDVALEDDGNSEELDDGDRSLKKWTRMPLRMPPKAMGTGKMPRRNAG